jgi:hypothetical protein
VKNCFVGDFETTTKEEDCRVWLWGLYNLENSKFLNGNNIESFFEYFFQLPSNSKFYFHNLKFDGEFIFYYLFRNGFKHTKELKVENGEFSTLISNMGVFYVINICHNDKNYYIYDSLKIIPLPVKKISKAFNIEQKKGEIDYILERGTDYIPTVDEIDYVQNDVEIVGKALKYFFNQNLNKMTQASNAFYDYRKIMGTKRFDKLFPKLNSIDKELRQSYKGGFVYANPKYQNKEVKNGIVLDINSLYPWVMYECMLPYGEPIAYQGKYKTDELYSLYIQMFRCNFELKKGHLPTLQIKKNLGFQPTEYVSSSNGLDVTLCLTNIDIEQFFEHYDVYNIEWFNGWKFKATNTLFKEYIDKWTKIKIQATIDGNEGLRTLAKLMLNALYGKFGLNPVVKSKFPTFDGELVHYLEGDSDEREPIYIPVASFVTAYARKTTIESCQKNYERFLYADTDSQHLLGEEIPTNLKVDSAELGYWKYEGKFNKAKFLRAKSYIENMYLTFEEWDKLSDENKGKWEHNPLTNEYEQTHIACAGLPTSLHKNITFDTFKNGLVVSGKLQHKRVKGGVILKDIDFTIKI